MSTFRRRSLIEQTAGHLREGLRAGRWRGQLPGVVRLAADLGVSINTLRAALRTVEAEGLVALGANGRSRHVPDKAARRKRPLRVGLLLYEPADRLLPYIVELQHALLEAGHLAVFPAQSLVELQMEVARVGRLVRKTAVDAWVVIAGSRDVLAWFGAQPVPAFALFGRQAGQQPIAGIRFDSPPAYTAATRQLIGLGHQRIVLLLRSAGAGSEPGLSARAVLDEMQAHGLPTGAFNLPDWEETREGLQKLLRELFRVTPPTALIIDSAPIFFATQQFLARHRMQVPEQVSLICTDQDPGFAWCVPSIAHMGWDFGPVVRRAVRWAATVSRGGEDRKQTLAPIEFIPGGTIGPVWKR